MSLELRESMTARPSETAMLRLIFYLIATTTVVLFASQNLAVVPVYLIAGSPIEIPLIVLIGIAFFVGFLTAILTVIRKAIKGKTRRTGNTVLDTHRQY